MIHITINPGYKHLIDTETIQLVFSKMTGYLGLQNIDASVIFESDPFMAKLNLEFRGLDQPTDVLSFEMDYTDPETGNRYLGDIIISVDTAQHQVQQRNIPLMSEISLLFIHGLLHLNGLDHVEKEDEDEMWKLQRQILKLVGLDPDLVSPEISEE
jgi:probable rRNA maturation factor